MTTESHKAKTLRVDATDAQLARYLWYNDVRHDTGRMAIGRPCKRMAAYYLQNEC